mgnify:CR=1 FL=1
MDPVLYNQIRDLKENDISSPYLDETRSGKKRYKILKVTNRYDEHKADYWHMHQTLTGDVSDNYKGCPTVGAKTASKILATGTLTNSDSDDTFGAREWHGVTGVYMTPNFIAWAGHYSWPCNVFGNKAFYGIGFKDGTSCHCRFV